MVHRASTRTLLLALVLSGCARDKGHGNDGAASASASAARPSASAAAPGAPSASAVAATPPPGAAPPTATFVAATEKSCKPATITLATYQQRGDIVLGGSATGVAATWRVHAGGKPQEQVAFAAFDAEGKQTARTRGVGGTVQDFPPRVLASGSEWTVMWFDAKGLAYTRPKADPLPAPDVLHLGAVPADVVGDVALAASPARAVLATTPLGTGKSELVLFLFADEKVVGMVKALGKTHHSKAPHRPAVAVSEAGSFVAWDEGGSIVATHFDASGNEGGAGCTIVPAGAEKAERLALAATRTGAIASWVEGSRVKARALDASGCPASPIWTVGEGRWPSLASVGETAVVTWVAPDGRLLAARLAADGAPAAKGLDVAKGSAGAKDPPFVVAFGQGRLAFAWAEAMSPTIATKRLVLRIVDAACLP